MTRLIERFLRRIAWLLPRSVVYWSVIRVWATTTTMEWDGQGTDVNIGVKTMLDRWESMGRSWAQAHARLDRISYLSFSKWAGVRQRDLDIWRQLAKREGVRVYESSPQKGGD